MKDEIVPNHHCKELHDAAKKAKFKEIHEFEEGDHNMTWKTGGQTYIKILKVFFE
tara:strand:+ start:289 stop:453 length:165 start_codon:yes stop_codon:yes gene_type:complete